MNKNADADKSQERAIGGQLISKVINVGVIWYTARHSIEAQEMHREKSKVDADESNKEVKNSVELAIGPAGYLSESVVESREKRKGDPHR